MFGGRWMVAGTIALGLQVTFMSAGCAYRLPPSSPPGHYSLRLIAKSPEIYILHVQNIDAKEYQVPADGRMTLDVPASRRGCSVYLFDRILIRSVSDPFAEKTIRLSTAGGPTRNLSFNELFKLSQDDEGYHLLKAGK